MDERVVRASFGDAPDVCRGDAVEPCGDTLLCFGPFALSPATGELLRDSRPLKLQQQPFRILALLVRNAGRLLTREEIQRHVWGEERFVDFERGLNYSIMQIRAALGDDPESPRFVETLPRRGYRFIAEVRASGDAPPRVGSAAARTGWGGRAGRTALLLGSVLAALLAVGSTVLSGSGWRSGGRAPRVVVAVLPFEDLGPDAGQDHFGDGLTEDVIAEIGRWRPETLGVIARGSVMPYRGSRADVSEVGRALGVGYVLEGSVRRDRERARVTARLVRVRDREQVWVRRYDEPLRDILAVQLRIAAATAQGVGGILSTGEGPSVEARAVDPEAYRYYLLGCHFGSLRNEASLLKARASFEEAVRLDPGYVQAYVGLADAYLLLGDHLVLPPSEALASARQNARRALELDEGLAGAHAALANVVELADWDLAEARRGFERALALNPSHVEARKWYAALLGLTGRTAEAVRQAQLAVEIDPLSVSANQTLAAVLDRDGQWEAALAHARRIIELAPELPIGHWARGRILGGLGRHAEALPEMRLALARDPESPFYLAEAGRLAAAAGRRDEAEALLERLEASARTRPFVSRELAMLLLAMGRAEEALSRLEQAFEAREPAIRQLPWDPDFSALADDPRFQDLKSRIESHVRV